MVFGTQLQGSVYGSGIVGGLFVRDGIRGSVKVYRTATLMVCAAPAMMLVLAFGVHADTFKGMAGSVSSGAVVVTKALLGWFRELEAVEWSARLTKRNAPGGTSRCPGGLGPHSVPIRARPHDTVPIGRP